MPAASRSAAAPRRISSASRLVRSLGRPLGVGRLDLRAQTGRLVLLQRVGRLDVGGRRFAPGVRPPDRLQQAGEVGVLDPLAQDRRRQLVDRARQQRLGAGPLLGQAPPPRAGVQLVAQVDVDVADGVAGPVRAPVLGVSATVRSVVVAAPRGDSVDAPTAR